MDAPAMPSTTRPALGLALAGGGFRASLFHLGVLRRLAELDLLRRVEMISSVSGGSIVAAHYALLLRRTMGPQARKLTREEYLAIVDRLETEVVAAIRKNLRVRLLLNPLANLAVMLTHLTLGSRMVRLYERHLFAPDEDEDGPDPRQGARWLRRRRRLLLSDVEVELGGARTGRGALAHHNATQRDQPDGSAIPALVLNATSLNSGGRFTFSVSEIGDSRLGTFRRDEIDGLLERKRWMQGLSADRLRSELEASLAAPPESSTPPTPTTTDTLALAWRLRGLDDPPPSPAGSLAALADAVGLPHDLAAGHLDLGPLRRARIAARQLRSDPGSPADHERAWQDLLTPIAELHGDAASGLQQYCGEDPVRRGMAAALVEELYLLRAAERVSSRIKDHWDRVSLGAAVGASAAFPPVFPPVVLTGIYDNAFVAQLGLTDGGVYDNTGIQALADARCTHIIASDTGGVFRSRSRVNASRPRMMGMIVPVLREVGASRQREGLRFRRRVSKEAVGLQPDHRLAGYLGAQGLDGLAYFHINSPAVPPAGPDPLPPDPAIDRHALASLRTDLDSFGAVEVTLLTKHGYDTADRYVRHYLEPPDQQEPWNRYPAAFGPDLVPPDRAARVLRAGRSRFFRWALLMPRGPLVVVLALLALVAAWRLPLDAAISSVPGRVPTMDWRPLQLLRDLVTWTMQPLSTAFGWVQTAAQWRYSLVGSVVLLVALLALNAWLRRLPPPLPTGRSLRLLARRSGSVTRTWGRGLLGNLLWFVGLAPLILSLLGTAYAAAGLALDRLTLRFTRHPTPARPEEAR